MKTNEFGYIKYELNGVGGKNWLHARGEGLIVLVCEGEGGCNFCFVSSATFFLPHCQYQ